MNRVTEAVTKATATLVSVLMLMVTVLMLVGCGEPQAYEPRWTDMGNWQYRWDGPNQFHVRANGTEMVISRWEDEGDRNGIEWEWEDDGDIDLEIAGRDYDIDSPWDYDSEEFEGYDDIGGGFVMVWIGGKLVKKPKTWLAANPKYNKKYTRTKTTIDPKTGKVVKSTVTTTRDANGVAKATVQKTTIDPKTGKQTTTTRTTTQVATAPKPPVKKVTTYKKTYKKTSTSKRRK